MSGLPTDYNLKLPEVRSNVEQLLAFVDDGVAFSYRALFLKNQGKLVSLLSLISPSVESGDDSTLEYAEIVLHTEYLSKGQVLPLFDSIVSSEKEINGSRIRMEIEGGNWSADTLPSNNKFDSRPGRQFSARTGPSSHIPSYPMTAFQLPYHRDLYEAAAFWFGAIGQRIGHSDWHQFYVFIPQEAVYFSSIRLNGNDLMIDISGTEWTTRHAKIKGVVRRSDGLERIDCFVDRKQMKVALSQPTLSSVDLVLIDKRDVVLDHYFEDERWMEPGRFGLISNGSQNKGDRALERLLDEGEGPEVEFKPYVRVGDNKLSEIIETILAFANGAGGTILIGVDDRGNAEGIQQKIFQDKHLSGADLESLVDEYQDRIRKRITDHVNRPVKVQFLNVSLGLAVVLRIDVKQGLKPPYYLSDSKRVYVRRGATTRLADPDTEVSDLLSASRSTSRSGYY